jgi:hypothetical protein
MWVKRTGPLKGGDGRVDIVEFSAARAQVEPQGSIFGVGFYRAQKNLSRMGKVPLFHRCLCLLPKSLAIRRVCPGYPHQPRSGRAQKSGGSRFAGRMLPFNHAVVNIHLRLVEPVDCVAGRRPTNLNPLDLCLPCSQNLARVGA